MAHHNHHHHHHHKRHSCSNCCIGLNTIFFFITLIAGAIVTAVVFAPSVEYKANWLKINATMMTTSLDPSCPESCTESTNQVQFPYYFYDNGKDFPYEYDANDKSPNNNGGRNATEPPSTCGDTGVQCWNGTINFSYFVNSTFSNQSSLYVYGKWINAFDFTHYINTTTFDCWMDIHNSSRISILPIPRYSPGAAIAMGVLFSFSLLCLILIIILISIRCFCKHNNHDYQPVPTYHYH